MDNRVPLQSGTTVGGDFRIEKVLGVGGFGITYLAQDEKLDVKVAIKEYFPASLAYRDDGITVQPLPSQGGADYVWGLERFLAEAQTLARLRHPNIVRVSRYFKENETAYMVLGFVEGDDYEVYLQKLGRAPTQAELDKLAMPILDALDTVHGADLVHRDIKPQNIFIRADDKEPILLDFGAARQALGEHSRATAAFVSPGYSPPESHLNDPADQGPWTDIYAFAATLYRALVGRPPPQVLSRVSHDTYVPLSRKLSNPDAYRPSFLAAIDQALNVRREDRPQSVTAWRMQLCTEPDEGATVVSVPQETKIISDPGATVIADKVTRIVGPPRGSGNHAPTVAAAPPPSATSPKRSSSKGMRWLIAAGAVVLIVTGVSQIYSSFQSDQQTAAISNPTAPAAPVSTPSAPTEPSAPSTPSVPAPQASSLQPMGAQTTTSAPASGTLFANDPSLRRLATAAWLSAGMQNGYWTAVTTGSNGTGLYVRCRGADDTRRDSIIELETIPTGDRPLSGDHEVRAQIGTNADRAVFSFTSGNGFSTGVASGSETDQTAGQFLNFLHQLFLAEQLDVTIPSISYSETFQVNGAEEALNVCFGADLAQPWRAAVPKNEVAGGEVRNTNGAVLAVRCDTSANRGNSVVVFSTPFAAPIATGFHNVAINIGGAPTNGEFLLRTQGNSISGVLYHRVTDNNSRQAISSFIDQMRRSNEFTVSSNNPLFSETFSLSGSRAALSGCPGG